MKKVILGFIIGIVVCGVVSVSAITLLAKDVAYKDTNVEAAIDDLYDKADISVISEQSNNFSGNLQQKVLTKELTQGKYIVNISATVSWGTTPGTSSEVGSDERITFTSSGNSAITKLAGYDKWQAATVKYDGSNAFTSQLFHDTYYVVVSNTDTITATFPSDSGTQNPLLFSMQIAKIK